MACSITAREIVFKIYCCVLSEQIDPNKTHRCYLKGICHFVTQTFVNVINSEMHICAYH